MLEEKYMRQGMIVEIKCVDPQNKRTLALTVDDRAFVVLALATKTATWHQAGRARLAAALSIKTAETTLNPG